MKSSANSEEPYCSPWDLRKQEEKLKLLNEQRHISSVNTNKTSTDTLQHPANISNPSTLSLMKHSNINRLSNRPCSVRSSSLTAKKSSIHGELSPPPVLPPLPPGGLISSSNQTNHSFIENLDPTLKKISSCLNPQMIRSGTDNSRSFLFTPTSTSNQCTQKINVVTGAQDDLQPIPFQTSLLHFKRLSSSTQNTSLAPHLSLTNDLSSKNNHHGGSLQKISNVEETKQSCPCTTCSMNSPCTQSIDRSTLMPIDRYFWYHYQMSRRQAEHILEYRSPGSFLVRQSESGNHNDYSLSIRTTKACLHMRICYTSGFYVLGECSRPFSSVSAMIEYFSLTSVPIRGATHTKLGTPVSRWEVLSSALSTDEIL